MRSGRCALGLLGAVAIALLAGTTNSCSEHACTLIGCLDQFTATISGPGGSFPSGMHRVDVTADGAPLSCTFTFPFDATNGGPTCPVGLQVIVGPATICITETTAGGATSQRCNPIPDQFVERIVIAGTPAMVHVQQSVDGATILDQTSSPTYLESRPNGPSCDPVCRGASATWTLSSP